MFNNPLFQSIVQHGNLQMAKRLQGAVGNISLPYIYPNSQTTRIVPQGILQGNPIYPASNWGNP